MEKFEFISPTKLYFGKDCYYNIAEVLDSYNYKNIAFIYGKSSIKKIGLYDKVKELLAKYNVYEIEGVEPNPKLSLIIKAKDYLKDKNIDVILAVGGGSVIDSAKLLSHCMYYDGNPFDYIKKEVVNNNPLPVFTILTISASGSELSDSCVITNDLVTPYIKQGFNSDTNRPKVSYLDPTLTYSVSKFQTGCGIVDIMMHTFERYFNYHDDCYLSESFGIGVLKTVLHYGKIAINNPNDYEARAEIMLASSYSHNGLTGLGKKQMMRVHGLEHVLSGFYDNIAHGEGLSILFPAWCRYIKDDTKANMLMRKLGKELFDVDDADGFINHLEQYYRDIGMPTRFSDINIDHDIEKMALFYSNNKTKVIKDFKDLDYQAFKEIYKLGM